MTSNRTYVIITFTLALVLFLVAWIFSINFKSYFLGPQYGSWQARLKMIDKCDVGDTAIIGDSRAGAAYQPSVLGSNVRNFGFNGVTPIEQYFFIKRILSCKPAPRLFVLAFSPRQFSEHKWFWNQSVAFGSLDDTELKDIATTEKIHHWKEIYKGDFGAEPPPPIKNWLYSKSFPPYSFASMIASIGDNRHRKIDLAKRETVQNNGAFLMPSQQKCALVAAEEANQPRFLVDAETDFYYQKEIAMIISAGSTVKIGPIPISDYTNSKIIDTYKNTYNSYIDSILKKYGIKAIGDLFVLQNHCDFGDGIHVDAAGAKRFSAFIKPALH